LTGAIERRIGKFELANGGTIFLDEIGEMPYELQAKLLRVLQENEFERVGGKSAMRTDVRVIAATNRNLEKEVEAGRFRSDLFFRLNVFPLTMPPLRQRLEDIPLFVKYFMEKYSKRIGKNVLSIKKTSLDAMKEYNWPGNIRELEHLIERAIIISTGQTLEIDNIILSGQHNTATEVSAIKPLIEVEREHIVNALKATRGKVTGENGAAALLGLNGKTLGSRMRKLGIKREVQII
jgi:transcriptional regulator with GAF, ATPase, and Fis domain